MTLKPYHEHERLLHNYSDWDECLEPAFFRAEWYCPTCKCAITGPPWVIGEYIVTRVYKVKAFPRAAHWQVHMRAAWAKGWYDSPLALFESTRKRDALKHARLLERNRQQIAKVFAGDPKAIAENRCEVQRVERAEREEEEHHG